MIRFDKVTLKQYENDRLQRAAGIVLDKNEIACEYEGIRMPVRATALSAGYDIRTPFSFSIAPGESVVVPTGLRALMDPGMWLGIYIRSSLGFKHGVRLVNSVAVIDADYAGADNEGHLIVGIYNGGDHVVSIQAGEAFAQGIFQTFLTTEDDCPTEAVRKGGFGSTGK